MRDQWYSDPAESAAGVMTSPARVAPGGERDLVRQLGLAGTGALDDRRRCLRVNASFARRARAASSSRSVSGELLAPAAPDRAPRARGTVSGERNDRLRRVRRSPRARPRPPPPVSVLARSGGGEAGGPAPAAPAPGAAPRARARASPVHVDVHRQPCAGLDLRVRARVPDRRARARPGRRPRPPRARRVRLGGRPAGRDQQLRVARAMRHRLPQIASVTNGISGCSSRR